MCKYKAFFKWTKIISAQKLDEKNRVIINFQKEISESHIREDEMVSISMFNIQKDYRLSNFSFNFSNRYLCSLKNGENQLKNSRD